MIKITCFEGDGIGPEITDAVLKILNELHLPLEFEKYDLGVNAFEKTGQLITPEAIESLKRNKVALKGPCTTPIGHGFRSVNVQLRLLFDLYANIRPAQTLPNVKSRYEQVDLVVFRENTEDLYIGEEHVISDDEVHAIKKITRKASERIIRAAFDYAKEHHRRRVTCVHKANILKKSDGLFLSVFEDIAKQYPEIAADSLIVDACCMNLVMHPERYDVMVMPNLYGDIVSDLCSGLIGGLGVLPSCNCNDEIALFEAVHGSAPDIAGQNLANPTALLLSACMMLDHLNFHHEAQRIRHALTEVLKHQKLCTKDLGGDALCSEFAQSIIEKLS